MSTKIIKKNTTGRILSYLTVMVLVLTLISTQGGATTANDETTQLTIAFTNDIHSFLLPFQEDDESKGGAARIANVLKDIREDNEHTLYLDVGDLVAGSGSKYQKKWGDYLPHWGYRGSLTFRVFNKLGLDASVLGNHEFDFGVKWLENLRKKANFELLSANTVHRKLPDPNEKSGERVAKLSTYFQRGDIRVGVIGISTEEYLRSTQVKMKDPANVLKKKLPQVKEEADFIVVLSHLGLKRDKELARSVNGIDVIIGGHSHTVVKPPPEKVGETRILNTGNYGRYLGRLDLELKEDEITDSDYSLIPINEEVKPDPQIRSFIENKLVVGELENSLSWSNKKQSSLGELITKSLLQYTEADVALVTSDRYKGTIEEGKIEASEFFEVFWPYRARQLGPEKDLNEQQIIKIMEPIKQEGLPFWAADFGNSNKLESVVTTTLTGKELEKVLKKNSEKKGEENYLQVSGIDPDKLDSEIDLDTSKNYEVAMNFSLALGKGGYEELWKPDSWNIHDLEVFEVVLEYLEDHQEIKI